MNVITYIESIKTERHKNFRLLCEFSHAIFDIALRYFTDSHITGCSSRLHIDYEGNTLRFRDWGKPIPFEKMRFYRQDDVIQSWNADSCAQICTIVLEWPCGAFRRWDAEAPDIFYGMSGRNPTAMFRLMGLCREMEITSFSAGRKLTGQTVDDTPYGRDFLCQQECCTKEADGIEMKLTHEKEFDPAYIHALTHRFHALFPDFEISVNGHELPKSSGLLDLLYMQLNPMRILEPIFSYRSNDLDFTAALQVHPKTDGGPFIFSFLNCHATFHGGDHNDAVRDVLKNLELPFPVENLCIVFHCKVHTHEFDWQLRFGSDEDAKEYYSSFIGDSPLRYDSLQENKAHFTSSAAKKEFMEKIRIIFQDGIRQYTAAREGQS